MSLRTLGLAGGRPRPKETTYVNGGLANGRPRPRETTTTTVWRKLQRPQTEAGRWPSKAKRNNEKWAGRWPSKAKTNYEWWAGRWPSKAKTNDQRRRKGSRRLLFFFFFFSGHGRHVKTSLPTRKAGTRRGLACWRELEYFGKAKDRKPRAKKN